MGHVIDVPLTTTTALVGTVEDWEMLVLDVRSPLDHHRTADVVVYLGNILRGKTELGQHVKMRIVQLHRAEAKLFAQFLTQRVLVKDEAYVERTVKLSFNRINSFIREVESLE